MPTGVYERKAFTAEHRANLSAAHKGKVLTVEHRAKMSAARTTHGMRGTPTYKSWECAKQRCNNPHATGYKDWGGRGIKCDLTFEEFLAEVGPRPRGNFSIDRINNDGHYERGNLRWATRQEQAMNKRASRR